MSRASLPERAGRSLREGSTGLSLREEHRRVTRDRLIASAEALFQEKGYRATTVEEVAKLAGTTTTTFYRYFKTKSELALILEAQLTGEILTVMRKLEAVKSPSRRSVRAWVVEYFEMWRRVHALCEAFWDATVEDDGLAANALLNTKAIMVKLTGLLQRFSPSVRSRVQLRLSLLVLALDRIAFVTEKSGDATQREAVFDEMADMLYASVFELEDR